MTIKPNREYCLSSTDVRDINNKEMRQMHELNIRIKEVLDSHKPNTKEKKYISDDDLQLIHAILSVFTKEYSNTQTSAFDDFLKEEVIAQINEKINQHNDTIREVGNEFGENKSF